MSFKVFGVGEVLWDLLPTGAQMGGAPANFAWQARALGAEAGVVTRVGNDALGRDVLARFTAMGLATDLVQRDAESPTGTVTVVLGEGGVPRFTIHEHVAWDRLVATEGARRALAEADAVCFGSLGQRCEPASRCIQELVRATPPQAWRVFDINLRQHFYSGPVIESSLRLANVLKLNEDELPVLAELYRLGGTVESQLDELARRFALAVVALTRGARGSRLRGPDGWSDHPGLPVEVVDTVGAGDAFSAALTLGLLKRMPLDTINALANEVARHVCASAGATPPLPDYLRAAFR